MTIYDVLYNFFEAFFPYSSNPSYFKPIIIILTYITLSFLVIAFLKTLFSFIKRLFTFGGNK